MTTAHLYPEYLNADGTISRRKVRIVALRAAKFDRDREVCDRAGLFPPAHLALSHSADWYAAQARRIDRSTLTLKPFREHVARRLSEANSNARIAYHNVVVAPAREKLLSASERQAQHHELRAALLDSALPPRKDEAKVEREIAKRIREQASQGASLAPVMQQAEQVRT